MGENGSARMEIKLDPLVEVMLKMVMKSKLMLVLVEMVLDSRPEKMMMVQVLESWEIASPL